LPDLPLQSSTVVVGCKDGLVEAEVDDEILALSVERGTCYGMNRIGSRIWHLIASPIQICDLCTALLTQYRVDPDTCERQVIDLLEELRAEGLIATVEEK
jgi:hypothetical protein